jgi:hypothetical protein
LRRKIRPLNLYDLILSGGRYGNGERGRWERRYRG